MNNSRGHFDQQSSSFVYNVQPKAVRPKYRDGPGDVSSNSNIMHDKRVMRGSTYAPQKRVQQPIISRPLTESKQHETIKRQVQSQFNDPIIRVSTPEPVPGRAHMTVQTDTYLEDLRKTKHEHDFATQTNPEDDRPTNPLFIPKSSGDDVATWIDSNDLFDYDLLVDPVIEVLISNSLDQSLMEVLEEEELRELAVHRAEYIQQRNTELAVVQRAIAQDERREAELQKRKEQEKLRIKEQEKQKNERDATTLAKLYMEQLTEKLLIHINDAGYLYDPTQREIEQSFIPWLIKETSAHLRTTQACRDTLDQILHNSVSSYVSHVTTTRQQQQQTLQQENIKRMARNEPLMEMTWIQHVDKNGLMLENQLHRMQHGPDPNALDEDVEVERLAQLERIRMKEEAERKYLHDIILIQSFTRGNAARKRVRSIRAEKRLIEARKTMSAPQLVKSLRANLGFTCQSLKPKKKKQDPEDSADEDDTATDDMIGVIITSIDPQGCAVQAGLCVGDIVTHIDDVVVDTAVAVQHLTRVTIPGDVLEIHVRRGLDGREETIPLEVGTSDVGYTQSAIRGYRRTADMSVCDDVLLDTHTAKDALTKLNAKLGATIIDGPGLGVRINKISPGSPADRAELSEQDIILSLQHTRITDHQHFLNIMKTCLPGDIIELGVISQQTLATWKHTITQRMDEKEMKHMDSFLKYVTEQEIKEGMTEKTIELGAPGKKNTVEWIRSLRTIAGLPIPTSTSSSPPSSSDS